MFLEDASLDDLLAILERETREIFNLEGLKSALTLKSWEVARVNGTGSPEMAEVRRSLRGIDDDMATVNDNRWMVRGELAYRLGVK